MSYTTMDSASVIVMINESLDALYEYRKIRLEKTRQEFIKKYTNRKLFRLCKDEAEEKWEKSLYKEEEEQWISICGKAIEIELKKLKALCELSDNVHVSSDHASILTSPRERWGLK